MGKIEASCRARVTGLEGANGQLTAANVKRNDGSTFHITCDGHAAVLRPHHEARPGGELGLRLNGI